MPGPSVRNLTTKLRWQGIRKPRPKYEKFVISAQYAITKSRNVETTPCITRPCSKTSSTLRRLRGKMIDRCSTLITWLQLRSAPTRPSSQSTRAGRCREVLSLPEARVGSLIRHNKCSTRLKEKRRLAITLEMAVLSKTLTILGQTFADLDSMTSCPPNNWASNDRKHV